MLERYCVSCHNESLNTANFRLDNVDLAHVAERGEVWEKVVHKLRVGEMPPADRPQPSKGAHEALLSWLVTSLDEAAAAAPNPGRPAVHRLNRAEYANAIRDLLALEIDSHSLLPTDGADFGFDNIADSLIVSPMLLERYIMAASKISRLAIGDLDTRPSSRTYTVPKALYQLDRMGEEHSFGSRGGISVRHHFPIDAEYVIKANIEAPRADQAQDLFQRSDAPEQLDIRVDGKRVGVFYVSKPKTGKYAYGSGFVDKPPDKDDLANWWGVRTLEVRFPAKAGTHTITISFLKRTLAYEGVRPRAYPAFYDYLGLLKNVEPGVIDFEIAGPYDATGVGDESPSRQKIFTRYPTGPEDEEACATEILSKLARRAYRRPVTDSDMDTLLAFYAEGRNEGGFEDGIQFALERILVGPSFLFRIEADPLEHAPGAAYYLSDLELASRLSFFLWSSIPDDELLDLAERGELKDPAVLEGQVRRMLADARSESLVTNFATQWLHLRNVDAVTPDVNLFPDFDGNLRKAMRRETELFFSSQLREDRSVAELLSANYTFLNERLARHYGIPGIYGSHFRRVTLEDRNRGGLLGQASILTVTSYATRTSPVKRGKWLLENILGSPPPPPPANVPALPEASEVDQATTVRERMEQHRRDPLCASCHVKMDPLGFALENFDAIGKWRTKTADNLPLDSTGMLPNGTILAGPAGLRDVLSGREEEFTMTAIQKLLTYALGRGIEYYDQPAIRQIAREAEPNDYRWSSIILGIVKSTPFQMRRSSP
ncbi:MAG: DUF1592 domain-containing protein [Candidatus Hydrogenedentes bacterium]|nr:DUF1592 domain-containing protein [Candidatus Hydrogenedentota bacterium]